MERAERIFVNGNIYTMNSDAYHAEAIAVRDQMIVCVGTREQVMKFAREDTEVCDLQGKTVLPGLIENHIHTLILGAALDEIDANGKSKAEILQMVESAAKEKPLDQWIVGFGWNQEFWEDNQFPTKEELDRIAPNHPVLLKRTCGHAFWVNSKLLQMAGIDESSENPVGGEILRYEDGSLTGILTDTAGNAVQAVMKKFSVEEIKCKLLRVQDLLIQNGLSAASDMGVGLYSAMGSPMITETIQAYRELYQEGKMKVRMYFYLTPGAELDEYYANGPQIGMYDGRMTIRGIKLFGDGALGARSAWLLEDYTDRPGHRGNGRLSNEELISEMRKAKKAGFQTALHSIGDAAVKQALDAYDTVNPEHADIRFKIEHFMIAQEDDFIRIGKGSIVASMQFVELSSDLNMIEERVGTERARGAYAWRKVLQAGGKIAAGTDCPVDAINPFESLYYAVSRCRIDGFPKGGWHPQEALTRYEALRAYTLDGAYVRFEEDVNGSLETGKHADFVVIDRDYMNCAVDEIKDIQVEMTVIGGETVYSRP